MRWILRRDPGKNLDIEDEDAMSFSGGDEGDADLSQGQVKCEVSATTPLLRIQCDSVKEHDWRPRRSRRLTP